MEEEKLVQEPTPEPVVEPEPIPEPTPEPIPEPEPVVVLPTVEREPVRTGDMLSVLEITFATMALLGLAFVMKKKNNEF